MIKVMLIKVMVIIMSMLVAYTGEASAVYYESYNAIGTNVGGVRGQISITSSYVNIKGFGDGKGDKDYMVYALVTDGSRDGAIGSAWIAFKDGNNIDRKYSLVYIFDRRYNAPIYSLSANVSSLTSIQATVSQDSSSKNCWVAVSYNHILNWCFESAYNRGFVAGSIAQSPERYTQNVSDIPGRFNNLQYYDNNSSNWRSFSNISNNKCNTTGGYVLDYLSSINSVCTGPRTYTTNDCLTTSNVWLFSP